jgi:hypothetical protein
VDIAVTREPGEAELSEDVPGGQRAGGAGAAECGNHGFGGDAVLVAGVQVHDLGAVLDRQGHGLAARAVDPVETLHQQTGAPCSVVDGVRADHRIVGQGCAGDEVGLVLHHIRGYMT